jgi:hypothetical protein
MKPYFDVHDGAFIVNMGPAGSHLAITRAEDIHEVLVTKGDVFLSNWPGTL